jgi:hypothetical protein
MNRLTLAGVAVGLAISVPAAADPLAGLQPGCQSRAKIQQLLTQRFDEAPTALGLQANGELIQVFSSKDGATWTIVTTRPDGLSCIVALGQHWEALRDFSGSPLA